GAGARHEASQPELAVLTDRSELARLISARHSRPGGQEADAQCEATHTAELSLPSSAAASGARPAASGRARSRPSRAQLFRQCQKITIDGVIEQRFGWVAHAL